MFLLSGADDLFECLERLPNCMTTIEKLNYGNLKPQQIRANQWVYKVWLDIYEFANRCPINDIQLEKIPIIGQLEYIEKKSEKNCLPKEVGEEAIHNFFTNPLREDFTRYECWEELADIAIDAAICDNKRDIED